jgi:hypothetical protein
MSTQEQARQHVVQQRQHDEHLHDTTLSRAEETLATASRAEEDLTEQAREHVVQQRHHDEQLHDKALKRAEELNLEN